ncbi:MAG: acyltransferase [Nisaea sp.]|uniref:acyltransferase family protein n=1 Tax=Nisaea sp. TaxID=2024842 RepID=UPI001B1B523B|nr:acyltransferase [Nisaea sp.]MBO6560796.1 acyltransferase [Nisaea sp.]
MPTERNCFDEIRLALACIVLFAHAHELSSAADLAWMADWFDADFAVKGFFAISGYLVSRSFLSSRTTFEYFEKRLRRIVPAYALAILYCFLVGLFASDLGVAAFLTDLATYRYLGANLAFLNFLQPTLPGVFAGNPVMAVNGALWTIKIELMLYCVLPVLFLLYRRIGHLGGLLAALALGVAWYGYFTYGFDHPAGAAIARQFPGQLPYFAIGSFLAVADVGRRTLFAALAISAIYLLLSVPAPASGMLNMLAYPLFVIGLSQVPGLSLGVGRLGDLSYGVYLFHFPTLQLVTHLGLFRTSPSLGLAVSVLVTLTMAFLSWRFVEKGFLRRSSHYRLAEAG